MIQVIAVTHDSKKVTYTNLDELDITLYKWCWIDFNMPTHEEIDELHNYFHFHPLAIEDCVHRLQRPKLDYYDDFTFFVTHVINSDDFTKEEINFFVGSNFVVSFHYQNFNQINQVWNRLISTDIIKDWDQYHCFYEVLDKIVDQYFPIIYKIEDVLNEIEDNTENKSMDILLDELFDIRHQLLTLRHTVNPMRDLLYRMLNSQHLEGIKRKVPYFSDIYDHLLKLSEMVDSNREITMDIRDSYISVNSHQANQVMKILTIITSIFAPLTFIAGIYGMNFEYMPELTMKYGYFISLGLMGIIALLMFFWFKRKGWF
ncbi:magnesium Mg(2+) and cobalt Co(2+) transport protein CorA [Schinkia azotoformans MEV2011]|uniref:Magnesium transport protein CorA n=1 Tax=Schinkia azotoformans MEV2011 TaxID=1348973 RepID=A0A072NU91_SCHAZ|nr:magnesium/cobalt transporter CorA [Schinkia azotoformans]KEF36815.1 magnesium Mg(2+) and cobalt Co(2+) transport protein CorA [Schinkia azotoformans MEV2011]MEC1695190.1 magnesium/cobalt transporter CorA [Schinkia azotoformans]MEC1714859.1 magnesium/cobalt transporter CorA [Schinkia azotoformans]MEC1723647.1 magnesium/cobalt transporter CorA [Schinkia azotoformans]MEC1743402.1 magnesium/cobalt transporter CorA [Schinkia azotoformans]